jgi:hypothetical protein
MLHRCLPRANSINLEHVRVQARILGETITTYCTPRIEFSMRHTVSFCNTCFSVPIYFHALEYLGCPSEYCEEIEVNANPTVSMDELSASRTRQYKEIHYWKVP